jgi:hypothetical protein
MQTPACQGARQAESRIQELISTLKEGKDQK